MGINLVCSFDMCLLAYMQMEAPTKICKISIPIDNHTLSENPIIQKVKTDLTNVAIIQILPNSSKVL